MRMQVQHALGGGQTDAHQLMPVQIRTGTVQQMVQRTPGGMF